MSRYVNLQEYFIGNRKVLLSSKEINPSLFLNFHHTYYKVSDTDTLDSIAHDYYGHGEYYYILMYANNLSLPTDITPGDILLVPLNYKDVLETIANINFS